MVERLPTSKGGNPTGNNPCVHCECPDFGPDGRYLGTNTMQATLDGEPVTATVTEKDLFRAARRIRRDALTSGRRVAKLSSVVTAETERGKVPVVVDGPRLISEARQARVAQVQTIIIDATAALRSATSRLRQTTT